MTEFIPDPRVKERFDPFVEDVLSGARENTHSIYIAGSALTADYNPGRSDINSVLVMNKMDLKQIEQLAPLGKKYGKKGVAAPLILTPAHINKSLDVFPIEILNIQRIHLCVFGEDLFRGLEIRLSDLRFQCERELKVRLIGLRQSYMSASGDRKQLGEMFIRSFSGYIPLFRGVILLMGGDPPVKNDEVLADLEKISGIGMDMFRRISKGKKEGLNLSIEQLNRVFEDYCEAVEKLGDIVDELHPA